MFASIHGLLAQAESSMVSISPSDIIPVLAITLGIGGGVLVALTGIIMGNLAKGAGSQDRRVADSRHAGPQYVGRGDPAGDEHVAGGQRLRRQDPRRLSGSAPFRASAEARQGPVAGHAWDGQRRPVVNDASTNDAGTNALLMPNAEGDAVLDANPRSASHVTSVCHRSAGYGMRDRVSAGPACQWDLSLTACVR